MKYNKLSDWIVCKNCGMKREKGGYCIKCGSKTLSDLIKEEGCVELTNPSPYYRKKFIEIPPTQKCTLDEE